MLIPAIRHRCALCDWFSYTDPVFIRDHLLMCHVDFYYRGPVQTRMDGGVVYSWKCVFCACRLKKFDYSHGDLISHLMASHRDRVIISEKVIASVRRPLPA